MQGVRLAHPALYPGWIILGAYLGCYAPLFVGAARALVLHWRWPLWLAIPISWAGWELIRSYAFTGFSAALLGHTQVAFPLVTQIADLGGTYLVSFLVCVVNVGLSEIARLTPLAKILSFPPAPQSSRFRFGSTVAAVALASLSIAYGWWRLEQADSLAQSSPILKAALLQRDEPLVFTMDPEQESLVFNRYIESAIEAATKHSDIDLFVWPESMFTGGLPYRILEPNWELPPEIGMEAADFEEAITEQKTYFQQRNQAIQALLARSTPGQETKPLLVGCSVYRYGKRPQVFGAALHINESGDVTQWYGKRHLVMFGEYIPFGEAFPWLYNIGPLRQGATPGDGPITLQIGNATISPSICFETMVEHVTGNSLRELRLQKNTPDLIINLTNDAWFQGSAILSHHRRCAQMVALMNRRPLLIAANQGPTTWIDGSGRPVESLPYQTNSTLIASPTKDSRWSLYQSIGDLACWPMAFVTISAWITGARARLRSRRREIPGERQDAPSR